MKRVILRLVLWYKKYVSYGYNCRFTPSCSEYTYEAIDKYGVIKGVWLGIRRVVKCNPWSKGGIDLLK